MKVYKVSYLVVGKTYTDLDPAHTIDVKVDLDTLLEHGWANVYFAIICEAITQLSKRYPHDQWSFVGVNKVEPKAAQSSP